MHLCINLYACTLRCVACVASCSGDMFDKRGDHPFTNYRAAYTTLLQQGYTVDILRSPWLCFDASEYGVLLVADPEELLHEQEVIKLVQDVRERGLSLLLVADWFDEKLLSQAEFFDGNTHSTWSPITGGSNVPEINKLLAHFDMALGYQAFEGSFTCGTHKVWLWCYFTSPSLLA